MATTSIILSEPGPSLEEILSRHELKATDLDRECPRDIRRDIAVELGADWDLIGCYLEFSLDELRDIKAGTSCPEMCRVALLDTWGKREGKGATFMKLAGALHRRKRRDLVDVLCAKLKSTLSLVPVSVSVDVPSGNDQQLQAVQQPLDSSPTVFPHDVPTWIETLEEQFVVLHDRLVTELSERGVSVKKVLRALIVLPFAIRNEYINAIQSMLPDLAKRKVIVNLFHCLNPLFTFIDYKLLQHLVSKFGSIQLKQDMMSYVKEVNLFKKVTTINELIDYWPGLDVPQIDYKMLRTKFKDDPKSYTLEKLDYFRNRFFSKLRLSEFIAVSILAPLEGGSDAVHHGRLKSIPVPSDHILTQQQLQALRTLLAPYASNHDKLKRLIQEKQEDDISRKEVEILLRQSGLAMIADSLKEDIEKGVENIKHYEAYEQALRDQKSILLRYLKFLFIGPPRSGKSSARRRLLREIVNLHSFGQPSKSTRVAEMNDVIIKKLVCESAAIINSEWQSIREVQPGESDFTYVSLTRWFYGLISAKTPSSDDTKTPLAGTTKTPDKSDHSSGSPRLLKESHSAVKIKPQNRKSGLNDSEESEIKAAFEELTTILQSNSPMELQQVLEELTMINMADVGGQPAILEMLPSLTIGPALYFLFFRLDQKLGRSYTVRYHASDKEKEAALESSYCTEDILYQSLSSIACYGCYSQKDVSSSSHVLLFGTHKDRVESNRISKMATILEEKLSKTNLYTKGLLLKTPSGSMFYSVDNMYGDESEMSKIRSDVEEIVKEYFPATRIPAAWLMFRMVLHLLHKPVLSFAQCEAIASKLSMPMSVQEALWFFHHNIGSLMYYSDIPSMQDIIICNPQVIFDSINELIIDRFDYKNRSRLIGTNKKDDFHRKGLFSLSQIEDKTECQRSGHLKLTQLVDLLQQLNIIAEVKENEDEEEDEDEDEDEKEEDEVSAVDQLQPKFIMPAVLKCASKDELELAVTNPEDQAVPIMICFKSGIVPFGLFCACTAHLITHQEWKLKPDEIQWRNKVTFIIGGEFSATIISRGESLAIQVSHITGAQRNNSLPFICSTVRQTVINSLHAVISKMKFKPYVKMATSLFSDKQLYDLAFTCTSHNKHLMKVVSPKNSSGERYAKCLKGGQNIDLTIEQKVWFEEEELSKSERQIKPATSSSLPPTKLNNSENIQDKPTSEKNSKKKCGHVPSIVAMAVLVLFVGGVFGWYISSSYNHGAHKSMFEHTGTTGSGSDSSMDGHPKDGVIKEIQDLIQAVKDVGNWRALCMNLRVNEGKMDSLVYAAGREETKKTECLQAYFDEGDAKWSDVVKAVARHPVNKKLIAKKIARTHGINFDEVQDEL